MPKTFYTTAEVAKMFDVYTTTVADWIDSGRLVAYKTAGGHRRVRPDDLLAFLKDLKMPIPQELTQDVPTILIIDDDTDYAGLLKKRLSARKMRVETAESGFEGIYKIGSLHPDVVIVDLMMPGMDGVEVCEEIKSTEELQSICVIAMTGYAGKDLEERVLAAGADAFMKKPVDVQAVAAVIHKFTGVGAGVQK